LYIPERGELSDAAWQRWREQYQGARRTWQRGRIVSQLREVARELRIPLLDPSAAMAAAQSGRQPAYFPEDGHWNELGHAVAAQELARFLVEGHLLSCDRSRASRPARPSRSWHSSRRR
jgi:hypothetical protein